MEGDWMKRVLMSLGLVALVGVMGSGCGKSPAAQPVNQYGVVAHACCESDPCCGMKDCCDMTEKKKGEACKNAQCIRIKGKNASAGSHHHSH
jgi:hypothetical protein